MALHVGRSRLPEILKAKRMLQADLARRLNVSEPFISQVISGYRDSRFSYEMAKNVAEILGVLMEDLHEWEEY
jgi:transcriptional regulator with XRE-family HTH domain